MHDLEKIVTKTIIVFFVAMLMFPVRLFNLSNYGFNAGHLCLGVILLILPYIFFSIKSYWRNRVTIVVWWLRIVIVLIFSIVGFKSGVSGSDLLSCIGTIALTFFYEFGYFLVKSGQLVFFLKSWTWCTAVICVYLLYFLSPFIIKLQLPSSYMVYIRDNVHYSWPNHFSIVLVLSMLIVVYLSKKNKRYLLALLVMFPVMVLAYSRAAFGVFGIIVVLTVIQRGRFKFTTIIKTISVGLIMIVLFIYINKGKEVSTFDARGAALEHSYRMRLSRWYSVVESTKDDIFLGLGFRSASKNIATFVNYRGTDSVMRSIHNDYVDSLVRGGFFYFIFFWSFAYFIMFKGFKARNNDNELLKYLSYLILILLLAGATQNVFKDTLTESLFWICVAAIGCYVEKNNTEIHSTVLARHI